MIFLDNKVCTFFGHRECPDSIRPELKRCLTGLIEHDGVDTFYVGNQGAFDSMVRWVLEELHRQYPHIRCTVVLAYLPQRSFASVGSFPDTLLPAGIESVPRRYAIDWRNRWMLDHADIVVTYVTHSWGGAAKFAEMATRQKKTVINLADKM